jgi:Peptidase M15
MRAAAAVLLVLAVGGCGASGTHSDPRSHHPSTEPIPKPHPQAIEPVAGAHGSAGGAGGSGASTSDPSTIGDPTAHAPSLKTVKRELVQLNLCGGATSSADAAPIVTGAGPGFVADPGTQQTEGQLPELTAELGALGKALGVTIYGISGYRTPSHSVAVGGFADDPHTRGEAEDIGVDSLLRSSAAEITEAQLAQFHLYRPFDPSDDPGNTEVNHVQLIPNGGPLTLAAATSTYDPDPSCS